MQIHLKNTPLVYTFIVRDLAAVSFSRKKIGVYDGDIIVYHLNLVKD
jgi:hypothetical protein